MQSERSVITDERAQVAFDWLNDHTDAIGEAKAEQERSKILSRRIRHRLMLSAEGAVAVREAAADIETETAEADERYCKAIASFEKLKAKQELETMALEVWRTECANRRRA
jgi:hypothetical protein